MKLSDAIQTVLSDAKKPMRAAAIWQEIDRRGLATSKSADPAFLVACHIYYNIREEEKVLYEKVRMGEFCIKKGGTRKGNTRRRGKNTLRERIIKALKDERGVMHYEDIADKIGAPVYSVSGVISIILSEGDNPPIVRTEMGRYAWREFWQKNAPKSKTGGSGGDGSDGGDSDGDEIGLVKAFGVFWHADKVQWKRATPRILGRLPNDNDKQEVDFHDQEGVYVLYDGHRPIYVGRSTDAIGKRLKEHATGEKQGRWDRFSWFGFRPVWEDEDKLVLGDAVDRIGGGVESLTKLLEGVLMEVVEPSLNKKKGDRLKGIEYIQVSDDSGKQKTDLQLAEDLVKRLRSRGK